MTLASQGIFTSKISIKEFLVQSHIEFKNVIQLVKGQSESAHFIGVANSLERSIEVIDKLELSEKYELLAMIRSQFYMAAESMRKPEQNMHFLKLAVTTQTQINQLRGRS